MRRAQYWLVCAVVILFGSSAAFAFTASNADTIYNAYNAAFYATNSSGNTYYKNDTTGGQSYFWSQAEEIEMMLDCYERTTSATTRNQVSRICNGFINQNGSDWTWNKFNDDITWAVIAFSRAYLATSNTSFRDIAKANFDAMYNRAWDTNFTAGGLWWNMDKGGKNACINGPAAVAACYLYNILGDASYLAKAQACYAWERRVLYNASSGAISDSISTNGSINTWASTYNQGTFVGAGNFLFRATGLPMYYQDAIVATSYTQNSLCSGGIFPEYGSGDFGGFNGIGVRWVARMAKDQNLWAAFGPWLYANGNAAWNVRNTNNLSWEKWKTPTPAGTNVLISWDCSDSVVIMQVALTNPDALQITPANGFTAVSQPAVPASPRSMALTLTNAGASGLNWSLGNTPTWLNVSAKSGFLAGGSAALVNVSLVPNAVANLAQGRYFAAICVTNLSSGVVQSRSFALVVSGGDAPIAMSGFNAGVLAPNTATSSAPGATAFDIPNNYCFYQAGLGTSTRGLPPDGVFTSQSDGTTVFQLAPYGSANALVMGNQYPSSGTLVLATPQVYNFISILACSADGTSSSGAGSLVLNFTNGTHSPPLSFNAPDWFTVTTNVAIQGMGRLKLGSNISAEDNGPSNPNFYQTTLNLAALGLNQAISSITLSKPTNAVSQQSCGVFAVSGRIMPSAAGIVVQPQSTTNNMPGQGTTFAVVASGVSPLSYQWFYSASGNQGSFAPLNSQTNSSVVLNPVQPSNAGYFFVVVTNNLGAVTSSVASLTVFRAPVITQQPGPTNICRFAGMTNRWSVSANAALPVNYFWQKNGVFIASATNAAYLLSYLQIANSGNYTVVVSNAFGAVTSSIASLAVVAAPSYPLGQSVLRDRALGYWRLDETNGSIAHDYIAANNGTYTPKVLLGQTGYGLIDTHRAPRFGVLSTNNGCVTNIAVDFATSGNAAFSVEAWVNGGAQSSDAGLVTKGYGSGGEQFNLDCGGSGHAFRFFVRDAGGGVHGATSSIIPNNQWHHLVGVCDEMNGYVRLYVDGINVAQGSVGPYVGILSSALPASIGSRQSGTAAVYDNQFIGSIEEVAIYGFALSTNQILAHYRAATNRPPVFVNNPFTVATATAGELYSGNIATNASDPNGDTITFGKISGPSWLSVGSHGALAGTPLSGDAGVNAFTVSATDSGGLVSTATIYLSVIGARPIQVSASLQGTNVVLSWIGGIAPYQLQMTTNLSAPIWQNLGSPVAGEQLILTSSNGAAYFRVVGQ